MSRCRRPIASSWATWGGSGFGRSRTCWRLLGLKWGDFFASNRCCNEYRHHASKNKRKDNTMTTLTAPQTTTTTWNVDPAHAVAEFKVKHMMISNVKGQFAKVTGTLTLDESDLAKSSVEASIEAASIETREAQRDAHLKSAD